MLYRILLFFVKPQHESAMGIHISSLFWTPLPSLPILPLSVDTEPLFKFPEPYSKFPLAVYFTYGNISFHVTLFIHLTLSSLLPMPVSLSSMSVSPFVPCKLIPQYHFSRFCICVRIWYLSLSDLLHSV